MDVVRPKKKWYQRTQTRIAILAGAALVVLYVVLLADTRSRLTVERDKLVIAEVSRDSFQEFIIVNGTLQPIETVFLDAREGGAIEALIAEPGAMVKAGDELLRLSNSNLQLDVMNRESQLYEQLNNLRQTRLLVEQNELNLQSQLAEIEYQIALLKPQYLRNKKLFEDGAVSKQDWEAVRENYEYNLRRYEIVRRQYKSDSAYRQLQIKQLELSEDRMLRSLEAVGRILDNLIIKAPINGQFSRPDWEIGQSVNPGDRLGQIDVLGAFKARVQIDELYLPRVEVGQEGAFEYAGETYQMRIQRIYPTVNAGRFEVDMVFQKDPPEDSRRGQTLRIRLQLSSPSEATLLPVGSFYQQTGGNWVYVLESDGRAIKRNIRLGRKNAQFYEVLEGLEPGDRVVVSSYERFGENDVLDMN